MAAVKEEVDFDEAGESASGGAEEESSRVNEDPDPGPNLNSYENEEESQSHLVVKREEGDGGDDDSDPLQHDDASPNKRPKLEESEYDPSNNIAFEPVVEFQFDAMIEKEEVILPDVEDDEDAEEQQDDPFFEFSTSSTPTSRSKDYSCGRPHCQASFQTRKSLKNHVKCCHGSFFCTACSFHTDSAELLGHHGLERHSFRVETVKDGSPTILIYCFWPSCNWKATEDELIVLHLMNDHLGLPLSKKQRSYFFESYPRWERLPDTWEGPTAEAAPAPVVKAGSSSSHRKKRKKGAYTAVAHPPPRKPPPTFPCPKCSDKFKSEIELVAHDVFTHKHPVTVDNLLKPPAGSYVRKVHECAFCGAAKVSQQELTRHLYTVHNLIPQTGSQSSPQVAINVTLPNAPEYYSNGGVAVAVAPESEAEEEVKTEEIDPEENVFVMLS